MNTLHKVVACVVRYQDEFSEILAFKHPPPLGDCQIPKGTVEEKEDFENATLRELHEESGLTNCRIIKELGSFEVICPGGPNGDLELERQIWNVFILGSNSTIPDNWHHIVTGDGIDEALNYEYFWHRLNETDDRFGVKFQELFRYIRINYLGEK